MKLAKCPECYGRGHTNRSETLDEPIKVEDFYCGQREIWTILYPPTTCENCNGTGLIIIERRKPAYCKNCLHYVSTIMVKDDKYNIYTPKHNVCLISGLDCIGNRIVCTMREKNKNYDCKDYEDCVEYGKLSREEYDDEENNKENNEENNEEIYPDW